MIESESEHLLKKWGCLFASVLLALYGVFSMIIEESYFLTHEPRFGRMKTGLYKVVGKQAFYAGVVYFGAGIALIGNFFLPYSERFYRWERPFIGGGTILVIVGVVFYISRIFYA